jgi:hypothetical protein
MNHMNAMPTLAPLIAPHFMRWNSPPSPGGLKSEMQLSRGSK